MNHSAIINVMSGAAVKAGKGLLRDFGEVSNLQVSRKGPANFVTAADTRTEKLLHRELATARPNFGFLMEEGGEIASPDGTHRFIIDPLDGTSNFIHAIPYFCISIGLERKTDGKSEIIAGVIYDPINNDLFVAEKGNGAHLNDRRINVSNRSALDDSMLVTGNPRFANGNLDTMANFDKIVQSGTTLRYFGATALDLAHLAAGRVDACWYYTMQPWDIAAGILLIEEAGGMVSQLDGSPADAFAKTLLATNKNLHLPIKSLLGKAA